MLPNNNFKKIIMGLLMGLIIVIGLEIYGKKIIVLLSDVFQKKICTESFCIEKPKGWVPYMVKRNNYNYSLDLIKYTLIPWELSTEEHIKKAKNGIILEKDSQYITIFYDKKKQYIFKSLKKHHFGNNICYVSELDTLVLAHCTNIDVSIIMDKSTYKNENILTNIF